MPCSDISLSIWSEICHITECPRYSYSIATCVIWPKTRVAGSFTCPSYLSLCVFRFICVTWYYWLGVVPGLARNGVYLLYEWRNFALGCDCTCDNYRWLFIFLIFHLDQNTQHISHTSNWLPIISTLNCIYSRSKWGARSNWPIKALFPRYINNNRPRRNRKCCKLVCIEYYFLVVRPPFWNSWCWFNWGRRWTDKINIASIEQDKRRTRCPSAWRSSNFRTISSCNKN
jgi:hypothetical protein